MLAQDAANALGTSNAATNGAKVSDLHGIVPNRFLGTPSAMTELDTDLGLDEKLDSARGARVSRVYPVQFKMERSCIMFSSATPIGQVSKLQVGLAVHHGTLHMVCVDTDNAKLRHGVYSSIHHQQNWTFSPMLNKTNAYDQQSSAPPVLVDNDDVLTCVYRAQNSSHSLFCTTYADETKTWTEVGSKFPTVYGPAAAALDGIVYVVYVDESSGDMKTVTWNGSSWGTPITIISNTTCGSTPALVVYHRELVLLFMDAKNNNAIVQYICVDLASQVWKESAPTGLTCVSGLSACIDSGRIDLFFQTENKGSIMQAVFNGSSWGKATSTGSTPAIDGAGAARFGSKLELVFPTAPNDLVQVVGS